MSLALFPVATMPRSMVAAVKCFKLPALMSLRGRDAVLRCAQHCGNARQTMFSSEALCDLTMCTCWDWLAPSACAAIQGPCVWLVRLKMLSFQILRVIEAAIYCGQETTFKLYFSQFFYLSHCPSSTDCVQSGTDQLTAYFHSRHFTYTSLSHLIIKPCPKIWYCAHGFASVDSLYWSENRNILQVQT